MKNISFYQAQNLSLSVAYQRKEKAKKLAGDAFVLTGVILVVVALVMMMTTAMPVWGITSFAVSLVAFTIAGFIKEAEGKWN